MSSVPSLEQRNFHEIPPTASPELSAYLMELDCYLRGIVPEAEVQRFVEETADHFESLLEEIGEDGAGEAVAEFGQPRQVADDFIEAWYNKPSRLSVIERRLGPGNVCALALFGIADLAYWVLLQVRVFLPSDSAFRLPWSPGEIRRYFPEPLPFPDFSLGFLLVTGIPLLAPPLLGWIVGRMVPVRPHLAIYSMTMPMILVSYVVGVLLLPITDGLVFALVQTAYWLPVGCGAAYLASTMMRRARAEQAKRLIRQEFASS